MISHSLKFIFIHIPKTSGNSLSLFLKDYISNKVVQRRNGLGENQGIDIICEITNKDIKHCHIGYYKKLYGDTIKDYFKFTIVRNPYDRMLSYYFWRKGIKNQVRNSYYRMISYYFRRKGIQSQYFDRKLSL